jgi:nicotinamide mononucleotide transporter
MIDYLQKNWIEISGIVTSLICVWLNTQQSIWGWFWAIVSSGIYAITFFQSKLYSDMELQGVFILLALYGWYQWQFGKTQTQSLTVTNISRKLVGFCLIFFLLFSSISGYLHRQNTDASLPYLDSSLTAISLIATWMTARKYVESWLLWIGANIFYVGMYLSKGLIATSFLYILLIILAIKGYMDWRKSIQGN